MLDLVEFDLGAQHLEVATQIVHTVLCDASLTELRRNERGDNGYGNHRNQRPDQ
jgi:hypothetical protein